MTFKIDNDALKRAMMRHYEEKLAKDLREMFIYSQDPDMAKVWQLYMEEIRKKELSQAEQRADADMVVKSLLVIMGVGMFIYGIYKIAAAW